MSAAPVRPFILPSSEWQEDVGIKEDVKKLQGQMGTVLGMLGKANLAGKPHSGLEVPGAAPRSRKLDQIWIRGLPIVAIIVAIVAWLEPRYRLHREQDLKNAIKIEVEDQLREPLGQLENMRVQIGEIQGELKRISFSQLGASDEATFSASLGQLEKLMTQPISNFPKTTLDQLAKKLSKVPESSPDYWPTVFEFLHFASVTLSGPKVPEPRPAGVVISGEGFKRHIRVNGDVVKFDGGGLYDSVFTDCRIMFTENPTQLHNVTFINCVFELPIVATPNQYLRRASKELLASNLTSVSVPNL